MSRSYFIANVRLKTVIDDYICEGFLNINCGKKFHIV